MKLLLSSVIIQTRVMLYTLINEYNQYWRRLIRISKQ